MAVAAQMCVVMREQLKCNEPTEVDCDDLSGPYLEFALASRLHSYIVSIYILRKSLRLARFNKIDIQGKGPGGKWTRKPLPHWLIVSRTLFHLCVTRPPEICVNFVFKHIHAASIYTMCRYMFHSFLSSMRTSTS